MLISFESIVLLLCLNFRRSIETEGCTNCISISKCKEATPYVNTITVENIQRLRASRCKNSEYSISNICCSDFMEVTQKDKKTESAPKTEEVPKQEKDKKTESAPKTEEVPKQDSRFGVIESTVPPKTQLLPSSCGDISEGRIIGGTLADLYEFPWMVAIAYPENNGYSFECSGTLINERYVLTAAHCVVGKKIGGVRIGEYDFNTSTDCQGNVCESSLQNIKVEKVITHEDYNGHPSHEHDISLLRLSTNVNMTVRNAFPICLPVSEHLRSSSIKNTRAVIAGWGVTEHHELSSILRRVDVLVHPPEVCHTHHSQITSEEDSQFCAGGVMQDSCMGDSGGPLMIEEYYNNQYKYVQYGIVSHGPTTCGSYVPGVYTNVRKYMDWILEHIEE